MRLGSSRPLALGVRAPTIAPVTPGQQVSRRWHRRHRCIMPLAMGRNALRRAKFRSRLVPGIRRPARRRRPLVCHPRVVKLSVRSPDCMGCKESRRYGASRTRGFPSRRLCGLSARTEAAGNPRGEYLERSRSSVRIRTPAAANFSFLHQLDHLGPGSSMGVPVSSGQLKLIEIDAFDTSRRRDASHSRRMESGLEHATWFCHGIVAIPVRPHFVNTYGRLDAGKSRKASARLLLRNGLARRLPRYRSVDAQVESVPHGGVESESSCGPHPKDHPPPPIAQEPNPPL